MEVYSPWMLKYIVASRDWPHLRLRGISAHKLYTNTLLYRSLCYSLIWLLMLLNVISNNVLCTFVELCAVILE